MNKAIKKKWVAALRSGEYTQGKQYLRNTDNNFCCLGVLCNIHAQAHPKIAGQQTDGYQYMGKRTELPIAVMKWAGLSAALGDKVKIGHVTAGLSGHNDSGRAFAEIADAIEAQL